jgi:hypothetical protein
VVAKLSNAEFVSNEGTNDCKQQRPMKNANRQIPYQRTLRRCSRPNAAIGRAAINTGAVNTGAVNTEAINTAAINRSHDPISSQKKM